MEPLPKVSTHDTLVVIATLVGILLLGTLVLWLP